jgi:hypothetical protein
MQRWFFLCLLFSGALVSANDDVRFIDMHNPAQPFEMAAKLQWNPHDQRWDKVLVLYNGHQKPPVKHPVWQYLQAMEIPDRKANVKGENLYYKPFKLNAYCTGNNALSQNKPLYIHFDQHTLGVYSEKAHLNDWNCPKWQLGREQIQVVDECRTESGKSLQIRLPKNEAGCGHKQCINWKSTLGNAFNALEYSYWVKFPEDFDFVIGGKLPGVGSDKANTGGKKPTGQDGWSVRVMWDRHGKLGQYVYHPDQPKPFGEFFEWDMPAISKGEWHQIKTRLTLNTAGNKDGKIQTWVDGKPVFDKRDFRFRNGNNLKIERLLFSVFFGGNSSEWAPRQDQHLFIDDWVITPL